MSKIKYFLIFTGPLVGVFSLLGTGFWPWALPFYAYFIIPILEFVIPKDEVNFNEEQEESAKKDKFYDLILYSLPFVQYSLLGIFLFGLSTQQLAWHDVAGRIISFGIACVSLGINVGHELGHRKKPLERIFAKSLLLSSQYMHFIIEHNRGHHKNVATPADPASARKGEALYMFWYRSITKSYLSAWNLEITRLEARDTPFWSYQNEMLQFVALQLALLSTVFALFSWQITLYYLISAFLGILFFETVNYLEHYGLRRSKTDSGNYERVLPIHSWNSNHVLGRAILFEVTRHSDHHFLASRKYQILRNFEEAPQLPAGYPVMILCALVPPLWFSIMHKHMAKIKDERIQLGKPITSIP
jgi:alkane 1-monooxygenase